MFIRNHTTLFLQIEQAFAGEQHGPAGHTHGSTKTSHDVGAGKGRAAFHQRIQVRCVNVLISQGPDRIKTLVIREQDQDIGPSIPGGTVVPEGR